MNSATISQVICAVHVEVATFFHERPLTAGVLARCVEARRFSRVEEKRWLDAVHPLPLDYYARACPFGGGLFPPWCLSVWIPDHSYGVHVCTDSLAE